MNEPKNQNAKCARTVCKNPHANCRHTQTGALYCVRCARSINKYNGQIIEIPKPNLPTFATAGASSHVQESALETANRR